MILTIDSNRSITLPVNFLPGEHVLLIPRIEGGFTLIPIIEATKEEFEEAMEDELEVNVVAFRHLAKHLKRP